MMDLNSKEVLLFTSDKLGEGDHELGEILMKSFIHVLSESSKIPSTIIFYNSGVKLTTEDSVCSKDLEIIGKNGAELLICGTCADYYNIKEEISVGKISNMVTIVQELQDAKKVLKP